MQWSTAETTRLEPGCALCHYGVLTNRCTGEGATRIVHNTAIHCLDSKWKVMLNFREMVMKKKMQFVFLSTLPDLQPRAPSTAVRTLHSPPDTWVAFLTQPLSGLTPVTFTEKGRAGQKVRQVGMDSLFNCFVAVWPWASHFNSLSFIFFMPVKCGNADIWGCKKQNA